MIIVGALLDIASNISGVFPIDGDCERFLMCRKNRGTDGKIKGKVYKCPKGELLMQNPHLVS